MNIWTRGMMFGAVYLTTATACVWVIFLGSEVRGDFDPGSALHLAGGVLCISVSFGVPLGLVCGAVAAGAYSYWQRSSLLGPRFAVLGAIVGGTPALALRSWMYSEGMLIVVLGMVTGMIGGVLFLRFAVPGPAIPLRRTNLAVGSVTLVLMILQVAAWVFWVHGELLVRVSNEAFLDPLVGEVHKVPVNRNPIHMYFPIHGHYCYRISITSELGDRPPLTTTCISLDSVAPDQSGITAMWVDEQTLRTNFDSVVVVEAAASRSGESNWRVLDPN